jgi:hypothetical protein
MTQPKPEFGDYNRLYVCGLREYEKAPDHAIFVAHPNVLMERIMGSKARQAALTIINDAAVVERKLDAKRAAIRAERAALEARADEVAADQAGFNEDLAQELFRRLTALAARVDSLEAARQHDPDDDELPLPPIQMQDPAPLGLASGDSGELETPVLAPSDPTKDKPEEQDPELPRLPAAGGFDHA